MTLGQHPELVAVQVHRVVPVVKVLQQDVQRAEAGGLVDKLAGRVEGVSVDTKGGGERLCKRFVGCGEAGDEAV